MFNWLTIKTIDNSPPDMAGGSVGKEIEISTRTKTGKTVNLKLYKFWIKKKTTAEDSGNAITLSNRQLSIKIINVNNNKIYPQKVKHYEQLNKKIFLWRLWRN
jgi:hypothetical protein